MTLPPYEPDGSLPPIPVEDVTAKDLIARYGVSKQTIYTRLSSIGVTGTKRGKQVFFSPVEVHQLDAAHHWLGKGYGLRTSSSTLEGPGDQVVDVGVPMEEITPASKWSRPCSSAGTGGHGTDDCSPAGTAGIDSCSSRILLLLSDAPGVSGQEVPTNQSVASGDPGSVPIHH